MFGQRMGHSHGQPALSDVKYGAGGASTQVNGSDRMNGEPWVGTALGNRGHIIGGLEHDVVVARAASPWIPDCRSFWSFSLVNEREGDEAPK
jgi:hypothetical protein